MSFCGIIQKSRHVFWHFLIDNEMMDVSGDKITRAPGSGVGGLKFMDWNVSPNISTHINFFPV